jgi:hypothetical protein
MSSLVKRAARLGKAAAVLAPVLAAAPALAGHGDHEPARAVKFQAQFIRAYEPCDPANVNDTTFSLLLPACHPAVPVDDVCAGFDPTKGNSSVKAQVQGADIKLSLKMSGLDAGCEGQTLCFISNLRIATDNCQSRDPGGCTIIDLVDFPITTRSCCVVSGGKCRINTSINQEIPGGLTGGQDISIEIIGCGMRRTTGPGAPKIPFRCGVIVK